MKNRLILFLLFIILLSSCIVKGGSDSSSVNNTSKDITSSIVLFSDSTIPNYKIIKQEDLSLRNNGEIINRVQLRIILPKNLTINEVIDNFRLAALDLSRKVDYNAISILAYYDENEMIGQYTIGIYEFCPFGDWDKSAEKVSINEYRESYDVNKSYYDPRSKSRNVGEVVLLNRKEQWDRKLHEFVKAYTVKIFDNPTNMGDEFIVKEFKNGTKARIVDIFEKPIAGGSIWRSYKIDVNGCKGWVSDLYVEEIK